MSNKVTAGDNFAEADDTPRPLRIIKRGQHVPLELPKTSSSPHSSPHSSLRSIETVPHEEGVLSAQASSILHGHTGTVGMAHSSSGLPSVAWPAGSGERLDVPKQRRTRARLAQDLALARLDGTGTGTFLCLANTTPHPHHPHHLNHLDHPNPNPNPDPGRRLHNTHNTHTPRTVRASTTGTVQVITSNPSNSTSRTRLIPSSPPFVSNLRPRAFTATTSLGYSQNNPSRLPSQEGHRTQPSLRSRLLSRVMNGVAGKARASNATAEPEATTRKSHSNSENETEPCKGSQPTGPRPGASSSLGTAAIFDGDLDSALAAFPTPPKSAMTSPTTLSSSESSRTTSLISRTLVEHRNATLASAQLNVLPEIGSLGIDDGQSVLVAVEVVGVVTPLDDVLSPVSSILKPLDVAIVIDNSLFASPGALIANCEVARFLASQLDNALDRLAVLCTSPINPNAKEPNVILPLSRTSIRKIKSTVDAIVSSTDKPEPAALGMALDRAVDLLAQPTGGRLDNEPGGEAYGHVFILTANSAGVPSVLLSHATIQVHILRPGALPWTSSVESTCSGWKLAPLYSSSVQYMSLMKDKDKDSLFNRLRNLVALARSGKPCGRLTDMVLETEAGQNCSIEEIMGQTEIASLRPGEVITSLVRVRVGATFAKGYTLSPSPSLVSSGSPSNPKDVLNELDVMLGASPIPILVAKLTYRHSFLPVGTRCSIVAAAKVRRSLPRTDEGSTRLETIDSLNARPRAAVQKRLALNLATHHPPREAISVLRQYFGEDGQSFCTPYVRLAAEELKYQARIVERFDLPNPIKGNFSALLKVMPQQHFGQALFNISNHKPQHWLTGVSDDESTTSASPKTQSSSSNASKLYIDPSKVEISCSKSGRPGISMPSARQDGVPLSTHRAGRSTPASTLNFRISQAATAKVSMDEARRIRL
ncbi:MAG: hypothetical protein Q9195_003929 [Heterodermia aff. obscurata]